MRRWLCASLAFVPFQYVVAQEAEFKSCVTLVGAPYVEARSEFLAKPSRDLLLKKRDEENATWLEKTQAEILLGWMDHGKQYADLLKGSVIHDKIGQPHYYWRRSKPLDARFVPLLQELILRGGDHANAQTDAAVTLVMTSLRGANVDHSVFLSALEDPLFEQQLETRRAAAYMVSKIGAFQKQFKPDKVFANLQKEKDIATSRLLLSAVAKAAKQGSDREKVNYIEQIAKDANILKKVGEPVVMRAVANIGGQEAVNVIAPYLRKTKDEDQVFWAIGTLAGMDDKNAINKLQKYAEDATTTRKFSEFATDALAEHYEDEIKDKDQSIEEQKEAIECLFDIYKIQRQRNNDMQPAKDRLENLAPKLTLDLQQYLQKKKEAEDWIK